MRDPTSRASTYEKLKKTKFTIKRMLLPCNDQATAYDKDFTSSETEGMMTPEKASIIIKESNRA